MVVLIWQGFSLVMGLRLGLIISPITYGDIVRSAKNAPLTSYHPMWALSALTSLPGGTNRSGSASKSMNQSASCPGILNHGSARTGQASHMFRLSDRFAIPAGRSESGGHWSRVSRKAILPRALQMAAASGEYSSWNARFLAVQGISRICEQAGSAGSTVSGHTVTGPTVCTVTSTDWSVSSGTSFTIKVQLLCSWPETQVSGGSAGCRPSITPRLQKPPTRDHVFPAYRVANVSSRLAFATPRAAPAVPPRLASPNVPLYPPREDGHGPGASCFGSQVPEKGCLASVVSDRVADSSQSGGRNHRNPPKWRLRHDPQCRRPAGLEGRSVASRER